MKRAVLWLARAAGLFALAEFMTRHQLRILAYHGIWEGPGQFGNFLFMRPETFAARMRFLARRGTRVLPLGEALERLREGRLPRRAVVITIDDGWQGACRVMGECLEREGFPATLYVCSYYADKQRPVFDVAVAWLYHLAEHSGQAVHLPAGLVGGEGAALVAVGEEELRRHADTLDSDLGRQALLRDVAGAVGVDFGELESGRQFHLGDREELAAAVSRGVDLQLHTHRHRTRLHGESCLGREIADNRRWLEPLAGSPLEHFCYPSGRYRETDWPVLRESGVRSATTTEIGLADRHSPPLALPRILDGQMLSELELEAELSGFLSLVRRFRRRLFPGRGAAT